MTPRWIVAGLFAPLVILVHEAGHAVVAMLRRCEDVAIHYQYVSGHCDASTFGDLAQLAGGPLTSWLLVLVGWLLARRRAWPEALLVAVCSAGRALVGLDGLVLAASQTDESRMAELAGLPRAVFVVPQAALTIATFLWAYRFARQRGLTGEALTGTIVACASGALYMFVVGPAVLP